MSSEIKSEISNKRIAKNTMALYVRMILQMFIGLYTSRVILQALGINDFGIYNVIGSVTTMLSFIEGAMSNATMRFVTFELGKGDTKRLNDVFCVSMNIHIFISVVTFFLLESGGLWFLYNKMIILPDRIDAAFWVLQFSIATCIIGIISVPYNACIIAHERMGAFAFISLFQTGIIFILALLLPYYSGDRLIMYAIILMIVQILIRIIYGIYCKYNFQETAYHLTWNKPLLVDMAKFAGWTMNGNIAWLGYTQGLNVLINIFHGTVVNAARGVAFNVQSKILNFCDNFQTAVRPQITKSYSIGDYKRMHSLIINSSKYSYYLMLLLSLPVYIEIEQILHLWLGAVPEHSSNFIRIILLCSIVDILRNPINAAAHATGNIKKYQLIEASTLLLIVPIAYLSLKIGLPVETAFLVQLIIFIIVQFERVWIVCPQIHMKKSDYYWNLIWPMVKVTFITCILPIFFIVIWPIQQNNYIQLFCFLLLPILTGFFSIYFVGLKESERNRLMKFIKNKLS